MLLRNSQDDKTAPKIFKILKGYVSCSGVFKAFKRFKRSGSAQPIRVIGTPKRPNKDQKTHTEQPNKTEKKSSKELHKTCSGGPCEPLYYATSTQK